MTDLAIRFIPCRDAAEPGSSPDVLQMVPREVRFSREVAAYVGVRTPASYRSSVGSSQNARPVSSTRSADLVALSH